MLRDLDRLQDVEISKDGQRMVLRTPATGVVGPLFKAARVALPHNVRDTPAPKPLNRAGGAACGARATYVRVDP